VEEWGPCPVFASFTLAFALQPRKKHGKTSVRVRKTSVRLRKTSVRLRKTSVRLRKTSVGVQYTYYQNTHTLQNPHKRARAHTHTHTHTHTYTHIIKQYKTTRVQIKTNTVIWLRTESNGPNWLTTVQSYFQWYFCSPVLTSHRKRTFVKRLTAVMSIMTRHVSLKGEHYFVSILATICVETHCPVIGNWDATKCVQENLCFNLRFWLLFWRVSFRTEGLVSVILNLLLHMIWQLRLYF
jgi:hypothetical protein